MELIFPDGEYFTMGNQTNNPHGSQHANQGNDQQHSKERQRDDDMSKRGGNMGKDQMGKHQKQSDDRTGTHGVNDRSRSGSQNR
jgi:hypothetical protein